MKAKIFLINSEHVKKPLKFHIRKVTKSELHFQMTILAKAESGSLGELWQVGDGIKEARKQKSPKLKMKKEQFY